MDRNVGLGLTALEVEAAGRVDRLRGVEVEDVGGVAALVDLLDRDRAVGRKRSGCACGESRRSRYKARGCENRAACGTGDRADFCERRIR